MSKAYWSGPGRGGASRFADDPPAYPHDPFEPTTENFGRVHDYPDHDYGDDYGDEAYDEYDDYGAYRDTRWRWIAGIAGIVLAVALVAIAVASHSGDTATRSVTPAPSTAPEQDAVSTTPRTVIATVPPSAPTPTAALPPETVVTVTTTPSAQQAPPAAAPAEPEPPSAIPPTQTITYTVTGTRQLFDLVSIIYTDEQGFPRTDVNVALPWSRTIVLNPGVVTKSVTATSLTGQLNCSVTDATGATLAARTNNAAITSCTP